jgi:hypothetical protein
VGTGLLETGVSNADTNHGANDNSRNWDPPSSGILHSRQLEFLTDILGQPIGPIFKGQEILDFLTPEDDINRLCQNISKELPLYTG